MQNLKPTVLTALQTASALSTMTFYFHYPPDFLTLPVGTYFEANNVGNLFADDLRIGSEIIFQIDLWSRTSLSDYAIAVNDAMASIDFVRISSQDKFDRPGVYQKSMKFRRDYSDPNF